MINYCKLCLTPTSRPRIIFTNNICNACINAKKKSKVNWNNRKKEFLEIIKKIKKKSNEFNQEYDCIVPWSGGKDSSYIAHRLKFEFGLNPLLVTFSPLIINQIGEHNRQALIRKGFDSIFFRPNEKVSKELAKRFFIERGNPKVAWDAGINSVPIQIAINYKIPYVFYAEHGESEYGGLVLHKNSNKIRDFEEVIEHQIGDHPENWISENISKKDIKPYIYPSQNEIKENKITSFYFSYFFKWSMYENFNYIKKKVKEFKTLNKPRSDGTFTNFDSLDDKIDNIYYYMQYIKFGFGRATRDSSRMIQNNQMKRSKALKLVKQYDHEFPKLYFKDSLKFLDLSKENFIKLVDRHRNKEIWQIKNKKYKLKYPPK